MITRVLKKYDIKQKFETVYCNTIAYIKLFLIILQTLLMIVALLIFSKVPLIRELFKRLYWKGLNSIIGMKVKLHGKKSAIRPLLIVSNHSSYLDISAINSIITTTFVAKSEVAKWPVLGPMAKLGGTLFINRKMTKVKVEKNNLKEMIVEMATPVTIFPEGTSNNGNEIKKFKSSLFSMIEEQMQNVMDGNSKDINIQPMTIAYTKKNSKKLKPEERDTYAWYLDPKNPAGDEDFAPHFWNMLKQGDKFTVEIILHEPLNLNDFKNRKEIAQYCQEQCQKGLNKLIG